MDHFYEQVYNVKTDQKINSKSYKDTAMNTNAKYKLLKSNLCKHI